MVLDHDRFTRDNERRALHVHEAALVRSDLRQIMGMGEGRHHSDDAVEPELDDGVAGCVRQTGRLQRRWIGQDVALNVLLSSGVGGEQRRMDVAMMRLERGLGEAGMADD